MSKYISDIKGSYPLIISVPHGGNLKPKDIPDRINGVKGLDRKTRFTAKQIKKELEKFGITSYLLILNISRNKVDVNRSKEKGCESIYGEKIWDEYHSTLQNNINECIAQFGKCFLIDLHGQNHNHKIELGYCLKQDQLLGLMEKNSAVKCSLCHDNNLSYEKEVILGDKSFSFFLEKNGYKAMPNSKLIPQRDEKYFSGAYITKHYDFEKGVKGFQLEINYSHIRNSYFGIIKFSKAFSKSLREYFEKNNF